MMKKLIFFLLLSALAASCAQKPSVPKNLYAKQALEAYIAKYYPGAVKTALGAYILPEEEKPGSGASANGASYVRMDFSISDIKGNYISSTLESVNRQIENYVPRNYYGPEIFYIGENKLPVGLEEILSGNGTELGAMKAGGRRRALVPGWLSGTKRYASEQDYINNVSGTDAIYEISLKDVFDDENSWEKDSLARFIAANFPSAKEDTRIGAGSSAGGWYYLRTAEPSSDTLFPSDSVIYCNYTLRRLDGTVVDTSVEQVAKDNDLYVGGKKYEPQGINLNSDYTLITMGSSDDDVLDGFAYAFLKMHPHESGSVFFCSYLGYADKAQSKEIPKYCPLWFEIQIVEKP